MTGARPNDADFDADALRAEFRASFGDAGVELDVARLQAHAAGIASGDYSAARNRLPATPSPAGPEDVDDLEALRAGEAARLEALGRAALAGGEVAAVVLNGGMATRFGGGVKGIVPALDGRSFLELKLAQVQRAGAAPLLLMNSFATAAPTRAFLAERGLADAAVGFLQSVSLRLTPDGQLFRDAAGRLSPYAPGHGDFPDALLDSGQLDALARRGVRTLLLSNVDNLGADLDPRVLGYHLSHGCPLTAEVAATLPGDAGGAPARVDGVLQVVEGFRWPADFDLTTLPYLNTNTFWLSLDALRAPHRLTWFYVRKQVDGRAAVQMERLVNELSARVPSRFAAVPRRGPRGRFYPVKTRDDLEELRADPDLSSRF